MKETWKNILFGTFFVLATMTTSNIKNHSGPKPKRQKEEIVDVDYEIGCDTAPPIDLDTMIEEVAKEFNINPKMIASTVYRESNCDKDAIGSQGEIGLGQIHPRVWGSVLSREGIIHKPKDLYDPKTNLRATAFVLDKCRLKAKGSAILTFRCYNGSGSAAKKYATEQMKAYRLIWLEEPTA